MGSTNTWKYICAGVGTGAALGLLFAPKSGAQTRDTLRGAAHHGIDRVKDRAHDVGDVYERRGEIIDAGKEHLHAAIASGQDAYRETVAAKRRPEMSSLAAVGLLAFEAAAVLTAYRFTKGLKGGFSNLLPQLEGLLHTSREAVSDTSDRIAAFASAGHRILQTIEHTMGGRRTE